MTYLVGLIFEILSCAALLGGAAFAVIGGIGVVRLPDFYSRLHGGGVTDTLGAGLVMVGLMLQAIKVGLIRLGEAGFAEFEFGPWLVTIKLAMILFFLLVTSPTGCHALAQAALSQGVEPQLADDEGQSARD